MNRIIKLLVLMIVTFNAQSQDLHFSQYFNAPLLVNPANTGFMPDGDYRISGSYRNQWAAISNPYKTMSLFGDVQLFQDRFENGWIGLGGGFYKDVAGSGNLTATKGFASVAYHQALGLGSLISTGFGMGFMNKRVDFTKLTFDNQWNGKFFDVTVPPGEAFITNSVNFFSLQAGLNYAYFPTENTYLNFGYSASNLNRPKESFFDAATGGEQSISVRHTFFLNGSFKSNELWILNPNIYVSKVGSATELVAGMNAQRNLSGDGNTQLITGLYYRVSDAIIPMIGFQQNNYKFTFSYDATMSSLKTYNGTRGAYELSIIKQGLIDPSRDLKCPAVRF
jgi:type IX secretion system PorP/SprF family membrane protein